MLASIGIKAVNYLLASSWDDRTFAKPDCAEKMELGGKEGIAASARRVQKPHPIGYETINYGEKILDVRCFR